MMRFSRWLALACVVTIFGGVFATGCKRRPSPEQCQELCWKHNELNFWEQFDEQTKDLGPAAKEEARAERQKLWDEMKSRTFDPGLKNCITACKRGGELKMVACMEKAETGAAARACFK